MYENRKKVNKIIIIYRQYDWKYLRITLKQLQIIKK